MHRINKNYRPDNEIKLQTDDQTKVTRLNPDEESYAAIRTRYLEEKLNNDSQSRAQRKEFAIKVYRLTMVWVCIIFFIVLLQGAPINFSLSDKVLITLLAGSSINIIGLMAIVIRHLFPPSSK